MPSTTPVLLLLGYGANVGQSVARSFAAKGYKVALTSRKADSKDDTANQISVAADLSKPESIAGIFSKVKASIGTPSVVVYNGKAISIDIDVDAVILTLQQLARAHLMMPRIHCRCLWQTSRRTRTSTSRALFWQHSRRR